MKNNPPLSSSSFSHHLRYISSQEEPVFPRGSLKLPIEDNTKLTAPQYRERLYQEITNRRRDARKREQAKVMQKAKDGAPTV